MKTDRVFERNQKSNGIARFSRLRGACAGFFLCAVAVIASPAQTFKTLVNFDNTNGALPFSPPALGFNGKFYGTTADGGTNNAGTVFEISSSGQFTTLYNF